MPRIFISHSSANNAEAIVLRDWLEREGWKDEIFLDLDPMRGISAGERWDRALNEAANRCEAVLFLVSKAWLASGWCHKELSLAHRLNKRLFGILIEDLPVEDLPKDLTGEWQLVRLASGRDHVMLHAIVPITHEEVHLTFSAEGLLRLQQGLQRAGLNPKNFAWPPAGDPDRPPYRGLKPLEADDAGIFFGRDAPVVEALDRLRGLRDGAPPRLLAILGASGAGKSSFLRAGLVPRLARDDRHFLPLPIIRPDREVISGKDGLLRALERSLQAAKIGTTLANLRMAIEGGAAKLRPLLQSLVEKATPAAADQHAIPKPPTLVISIDQGEELFLAEGQNEAQVFLTLLRDLLSDDAPTVIVVFTIRSDSYELLQASKPLEGIKKVPFDLSPMPKGSYAEVIKGPALRLEETERPLKIEERLINQLLVDIEEGGAKDALPLLAFTLERLYLEHGGDGDLTLAEYRTLSGIKGSIEAAVERAFKQADQDPNIPKDRVARLAMLRRGLVPWLAGIDPETGLPRRRVARLSEIPVEARPLILLFVDQRLLATDVARDTGEQTIEPTHEALLRQWSLLQSWLADDAGLLTMMDEIKRASRDWIANDKVTAWLIHGADRLEAAERLVVRSDLAAHLDRTDRDYLAACRKAETVAKGRRRRVQALIYLLLVGIIAGLVGWINQAYVKEQYNWFMTVRPYIDAHVRPYVLSAGAVRALKPGDTFRECAKDCPMMVVLPGGEFVMGSPASEKGRFPNEGPQHKVTIAKSFAASRFEVTFAEWDACVAVGGCPEVPDGGFGRGSRPVINVTWLDAQQYTTWFSRMTGRAYRLLTEAEWEYAARAGSHTTYSWGDDVGKGNANCNDCGSGWEGKQTAPVGSFASNAFGLNDMLGNVWEWVQDCYKDNYDGAPSDGAAWVTGNCANRVVRGGSWVGLRQLPRSAYRDWRPSDGRTYGLGFRLARTIVP